MVVKNGCLAAFDLFSLVPTPIAPKPRFNRLKPFNEDSLRNVRTHQQFRTLNRFFTSGFIHLVYSNPGICKAHADTLFKEI